MTLLTHVLDATSGRPAVAVSLRLDRRTRHEWQYVGSGMTGGDGQNRNFSPDSVDLAVYQLVFDTGAYFSAAGLSGEVAIVFEVTQPHRHHHLPLPLSPFAYSTYLGS